MSKSYFTFRPTNGKEKANLIDIEVDGKILLYECYGDTYFEIWLGQEAFSLNQNIQTDSEFHSNSYLISTVTFPGSNQPRRDVKHSPLSKVEV
jgi:hypothetical protein